jgi:hypothetical protein
MKLSKLYIYIFFQIFFLNIIGIRAYGDGSVNAFYKATIQGTITEVAEKIKTELKNSEFKIIGEYNPSKDDNLFVIVFTTDELFEITLKSNRGALASALKVGLIADGKGNVQINFLNPMFLFYSYLRNDVDKNDEALNNITMQAVMSISSIGVALLPSDSGSLTENELKQFRFMVRMPSFDEPIVLSQFASFDEGIAKIKQNLAARKGGTFKVYELISTEKKVAIFGIGLLDNRLGEPIFLPVLGIDHVSAMPYQIILVDKTASMLSGRFMFPLFWSDLSMRQFSKIGRTYRDIQTMMEGLSK